MTKPLPITQSLHKWMDVFMHRSMRGWNQFAKSTGLSMPQFSILMQLHYKGACGLSEISERFDVTAAAASQLAEKLVQGGYLERTEDPSDRRAKLLRLSESGAKLVDNGIQERYRWMDEITSKLTAEERAKVSEALSILTEAAQKMDVRKGTK
ncbi:MAG: MarR family transcriptional regulator [Anaerolineales bacterium]|nr:MarR family transcriptional regulator [Anaerolineales bacterium]